MSEKSAKTRAIDWPVILIPLGVIVLTCLLLVAYPVQSKNIIDSVRTFMTDAFGWYYILIGLLFFFKRPVHRLFQTGRYPSGQQEQAGIWAFCLGIHGVYGDHGGRYSLFRAA